MLKTSKLFLIPGVIAAIALLSNSCERNWEGNITGTVTDVDTELPVVNAVVVASSMKNDFSRSTVTDAEGHYRLFDVRWGPNKVVVYHPQYGMTERYADVIRDKTLVLDIVVKYVPDATDPEMTVWVTNDSDIGIPNARVDLYEKQDTTYENYLLVATDETGFGGTVVFYPNELEEDEIRFYRLNISALGFMNTTKDFTLTWMNPDPTIHIVMETVR